MIHTKTIDERAEQVVALMRDGWTPYLRSGLYVSEVRVRKAGETPKIFAYHVMRHLEKHRRVKRGRTENAITWTLREDAS